MSDRPPAIEIGSLREQARLAVLGFVQALLDDPRNACFFERFADKQDLAARLFKDALVVVYRLIVLLKLEAPSDPPRLGGLFAEGAAPLLDSPALHWSDHAVCALLTRMMWAPRGKKGKPRRVDYAGLAVEDLGHAYEALLELSPGIATEPLRRVRRQKLEGVVPLANGEAHGGDTIAEGTFYLRRGLGRKGSGSFYTPRPFVRFLLRETLGPQVEALCPGDAPRPAALLRLKVLDPAMGSGHFLVEACRYLGDALFEACKRCNEMALAELPGPVDEPLAGLSGRGHVDALAEAKARLLCRRLVAMHCLYGVDKDPLAVELARLSLWLETGAEALPLTFLDHRLLCGDALIAPGFEELLTLPSNGGAALETSIVAGLRERWTEALRNDGSSLLPFKTLSAAWTGAVMGADVLDEEYVELARALARGVDLEGVISARPAIEKAIERANEGVSFDLAFPEVLWPDERCSTGGRVGFHAVVGNPPWDALQPFAREVYAPFDLAIRDAPTKREREEVERRLLHDPAIVRLREAWGERFVAVKRVLGRAYKHIHKGPKGGGHGGAADLWQAFVERGCAALRKGGRFGMVLPSAVHESRGASGIRWLLLNEMRWTHCLSFENAGALFEIHHSFKFALVVAENGAAATEELACGFYLRDLDCLSGRSAPLTCSRSFIERTGGEHLTLLELRAAGDVRVAERCYSGSVSAGAFRAARGIDLGRELHMTDDAYRFTPASSLVGPGVDPREPSAALALRSAGYLPLHEGKTLHQYSDKWQARPRYAVALDAVADKPGWRRESQLYRLALRAIAASTNERTAIGCMLPPHVLCGNSVLVERAPWARPDAIALALLACVNAYPFDHCLRQRGASNVNLFMLDACPLPASAFIPPRSLFLAHGALRLTCNHEGYRALWQAQLGPETWREASPLHMWPALAGEEDRWAVRAAIDAVVAQAYGLSREEYAHLLGSFNHRSHPAAPLQCLAAFDELASRGLESFLNEHDPYRDIPPVEALPAIGSAITGPERRARGRRGSSR